MNPSLNPSLNPAADFVTHDGAGPLSEERARRLWARASELQEEAFRKRERNSDHPVRQDREPGFELEHVRAAAVEAGIQKEFVDLAVAELVAGAEPPDPVLERRIARFLDSRRYALEAIRVIDAPPDVVLRRLTEMVTRDPYGLTLLDHVGSDVIEGGALVFKTPQMMERKGEFGTAINYSDMRELFFQARAAADGRTELRVRAPLLYARKLNYRVGVGLAGTIAAGTGTGTAAATAALVLGAVAGPLGWVVVGGAALLGATGGALVGVKSYRRLFRYGIKKGQEALDGLLRAVAVNIKARRSGLQPGPENQPLPPPSTRNEGSS